MRALKALLNFLKPDPPKVMVLILFGLLTIGGLIQAYVFVRDAPGVKKPPLYDQLKPYPVWIIWVMTLAPLYMIVTPLESLFSVHLSNVRGLEMTLYAAYYYILSCSIVMLFRRGKRS